MGGRGCSSLLLLSDQPCGLTACIRIALKAEVWEGFLLQFFPLLSLSPSGLFLSFAGAQEFS